MLWGSHRSSNLFASLESFKLSTRVIAWPTLGTFMGCGTTTLVCSSTSLVFLAHSGTVLLGSTFTFPSGRTCDQRGTLFLAVRDSSDVGGWFNERQKEVLASESQHHKGIAQLLVGKNILLENWNPPNKSLSRPCASFPGGFGETHGLSYRLRTLEMSSTKRCPNRCLFHQLL